MYFVCVKLMEYGILGQNGDHVMSRVVVGQECAHEIAMVHSLTVHIVLEAIQVWMNVTHMNVQVSKFNRIKLSCP